VHHPIKKVLHKNHKSKYGDVLVYFFALVTPLFMAPQAIEIFKNHNATNVALITWVFFILADIVWIIYSVKHKLRPLLYGHALYLAVETVVVVGILMYSGNPIVK
jgi:uncharacterized protein with PQ loop repeat